MSKKKQKPEDELREILQTMRDIAWEYRALVEKIFDGKDQVVSEPISEHRLQIVRVYDMEDFVDSLFSGYDAGMLHIIVDGSEPILCEDAYFDEGGVMYDAATDKRVIRTIPQEYETPFKPLIDKFGCADNELDEFKRRETGERCAFPFYGGVWGDFASKVSSFVDSLSTIVEEGGAGVPADIDEVVEAFVKAKANAKGAPKTSSKVQKLLDGLTQNEKEELKRLIQEGK